MYEWVVKRLQYAEMEHIKHEEDELAVLCRDAADAIESLKHTVEILCGAKTNLVRCCECVYHDDESQYHYCRKWRRNCPDDSDFFCKWGNRKDGGQDE